MSVIHDRFTIVRQLPGSPARAFATFADPALKVRWFGMPDDWTGRAHELDFRVGGHELNTGVDGDGVRHEFRARYHRIVPAQLIVFSYELDLGDVLASVSITTVEFAAVDSGTTLTFTEQGTFFDDIDLVPGRQHGTAALLDRLTTALEEAP